MAIRVAVFAGLGSPALFSKATQDTALADASSPEAQALLNACHKTFLSELCSTSQDSNSSLDIDAKDFQNPQNLFAPLPKYHKNAVIQNTTLCLVQMLRFVGYRSRSSNLDDHTISGVAGICSGLLVSMAVAACDDTVSFLAYGQRSFHLALLIGRRIEQHVIRAIRSSDCDSKLPWSIVVDGVTMEQAEKYISEYKNTHPGKQVYISARSTKRCLTISGRGDHLRDFSVSSLPKNCRIRPTNLFSPYHDAKTLVPVRAQVLADAVERKLSFPSLAELKLPLYFGDPISSMNPATMQQSMLDLILDLILTRPLDWLSAQQQIFTDHATAKDDGSVIRDILNFGPGYGVVRSEAQRRPNIQVLDMSCATKAERNSAQTSSTLESDVAIVGMAVDLPGAPDTASLWKVLRDEINVVGEIPESRFAVNDFYKSTTNKANNPQRSMGTRFGNFMDNPFQFDHSFFGISPREAKSVDPQQRVLLQTTYKALEDAGYVPDSSPSFARDTFGCYIGNATLDYPDNLKDEIDVYYSPGTLRAFLSGRISYVFGFSGPSMTIDTACSSSMVSIFHACRALNSGDCRAAVAGGVNVITSPDMYLGLDRAHFLSPTGQCKAFDSSADGYCRSEGCGIFVLKRLNDALNEHDNILGVIKGIEINQSGNADSITHPHAPTQTQLFKNLFSKADIDPLRVSVVEAHGTGTQAGDPQETKSIRSVLCEGREETNPLYLTSVKANIGHCEAASGAAALAKLLLMTKHTTVPKQVSLQNLNPRIDPLGVDGTVIARERTDWTPAGGQSRVAMLNNFGAAGSNGALLLQETTQHCQEAPITDLQPRSSYMLGFSAKTVSSLSAYKKLLVSFLKDNIEDLDLGNLCYTSAARRQLYNHRSTVCGSSVREIAERLDHTDHSEIKRDALASAIYVFSGQGSQYISMGKELYATSETFRNTVLESETWLLESGFPSCLRIINKGNDNAGDSSNEEILQAMQVSIFVVEVGLARMWLEWGVQPTMVTGHSIGQYAALVTAKVLEFVDALRIVACRARLMIENCPQDATGMLAVNRGASEIQQFVHTHQAYRDISIACCNSPHDCVVGGPLSALEALKNDLKSNHKYKAAMLANPMAYHTDAMNTILPELTTVASSIKWSAPQIPVICNVLGRVVAKGEICFAADFPARHCRQTVLFEQGINDALSNHLINDSEQVLWIEIGPHPSILPMVKSHALRRNHAFIASMRKSTDPWITLSEAQSQIYRSSLPLQWADTFPTSQMYQCITLPTYQFDYTDFLVQYPHEVAKDATAQQYPSTGYELLDHQLQTPRSSSTSHETIFETPIVNLAKYINGHIVCGYALCPASVYHEMALAAAQRSETLLDSDASCKHASMLSKIAYMNPLLYAEGSTRNVRVTISRGGKQDDIKSFTISSCDPSKPKEITHHCRGSVKRQSRSTEESKLTMLRAQLQRPISMMESMESVEVFRTRAIYEKLFPRVVTYSKMYQAIQTISISPDGTEALATITMPIVDMTTTKGKFAVNPVFMDVILHVAGFVANLAAEHDDAYICKEVKSAKVIMEKSDLLQPMTLYCSNTDVADGTVGNGYALGSNGQLLAVFKGMNFTRVRLRAVEASFKHAMGGRLPHSNNTRTAQSHRVDGKGQVSAGSRQDATNVDAPSIKSPATIDAKAIISEVCGLVGTALSSESELDGLGIDSLMILELGSRIQETVKAEITSEELNACITVKDIESLVSSKTKQSLPSLDKKPSSRPITGDSPQNPTPPLGYAAAIIAEVCGVDADKVSATSTLESLGIDSLMMFELEDKFREINSEALEGKALASCKTVGDIDRLLGNDKISSKGDATQLKQGPVRPPLKEMTSSSSEDSQLFSDSTQLSTPSTRTTSTSPLPGQGPSRAPKDTVNLLTSQEPLSLIQPGRRGNDAQPLILIHDGSGLSLQYRKIQNLIRPLWGISNPKAFNEETWPNIDAMAKAYAAMIAGTMKGPVILGGWSFGGVVAFHAAHILIQQNYPVNGILLIDSPPPLNHQPLPSAIIDAVVPKSNANSGSAAAVRRQFELNTSLLANFKSPDSSRDAYPDMVLLRSREGYDAKDIPCERHAWLEDREDPRTAVEGWAAIVGKEVRVIDVPGHHFGVFEKGNVEAVSEAIREGCDILEGRG